MFEYAYAMEPTPASQRLLQRISDASRAEAQAAAERLVAVADLFAERRKDSGECEGTAIDTREAVAAQVAATLRVSIGLGASYLRYAVAMRERLPEVGRCFEAGDINYAQFQAIVYRTDLIVEGEHLAHADAELAAVVPRWPSMTRSRLDRRIDRILARIDPDALRRSDDHVPDRYVWLGPDDSGIAEIGARVFDTTGRALDARLNELADTVCPADPRSRDQRRADALDTVVAGGDRLPCACGEAGCPATTNRRPPGNVVIHVVAEKATLDGHSQTPGYSPGSDSLICAEALREIARTAKHLPIIAPTDSTPEPHYTPSRALADYVRCRDITCRAPGCDVPAFRCDIDHTVPYPDGPTHASNLKCLCRKHHLLKTFCGWRDRQLPDGHVIWTLPGNQTLITTPGSAILFPALCAPTATLPETPIPIPPHWCSDKTVMMPRRARTRAQNRARAITAERKRNQQARQARLSHLAGQRDPDPEPPPF